MPPQLLFPKYFESVTSLIRHWLMVLCSSLWLLLAWPVHRRLLKSLKIPWCSSLWLLLALPAAAQETVVSFDVPAQPLARALDAFAEQAHMQILYKTETVAGLHSSTVAGRMMPEEALRTMLRGTGLSYQTSGPHTITVIQTSSMDPTPAIQSNQDHAQKPIKVPEVVVKDVRERPTWTTPVDGYKADHASTVTRSTMSIDETPVSIGVVTRDLIRDTFARTQSEAFEGVSGVARSGTRQGRAEAFSIRGFAVNDVIGSFNGVKANGLPTDGLFAPDWGIVERYEIVKGPASIVGGAATPGGVINRVTKTPRRETLQQANFKQAHMGSSEAWLMPTACCPQMNTYEGVWFSRSRREATLSTILPFGSTVSRHPSRSTFSKGQGNFLPSELINILSEPAIQVGHWRAMERC